MLRLQGKLRYGGVKLEPLCFELPCINWELYREEEPMGQGLSGPRYHCVAPGRHLISVCPLCAQCLSSPKEWSVMVAGILYITQHQ